MPILSDRNLFVTDAGEGDPVVMLHGLGGTSSMYQPQAAALVETNRVVRIDLAGSGRSPHDGPLSIESWADDIVSVLGALGIDHAVFVAHSLGTLVAVDIARRYPSLVTSLVALGPVRAQPSKVKEATRARAQTVRQLGMESIVDGVLSVALSDAARRDKPVVAAFIRESLLAQPPLGYSASCEALAAVEDPRWTAVAVPTWLVNGTDDKLAAPQLVDAIQADVPHASRVEVPGAGHWLSVEEPELVTDIVRKALSA
ncbi:alpha/beta hydrolase [Mycobacterium sp. MBM]|nr:alpha/beta hydrolase [Mycobacterium sp. MBM]